MNTQDPSVLYEVHPAYARNPGPPRLPGESHQRGICGGKMRRRHKMCYFIAFHKVHASFRNLQGDLHRDFERDHTSLGSLLRNNQRQALRLAARLAVRYDADMQVEQCWLGQHKGEQGRWLRCTWVVWPSKYSGPGQAPKVKSAE